MPACRIGDMITTTITSWRARVRAVALALVIIAVATGLRAAAIPPAQAPAAAAVERPALIPWPASVTMAPGESFPITRDTVIEITPKQPQLRRSADLVADLVWPALEARLAIRDAGPTQLPGTIRLEVEPTGTRPDEGYALTVTRDGIRILARTPAGVFYGVQTLRQLLPWSIELRGVRPFPVSVPASRITDSPRFGWRGAMLDVARHFFSPAEVKRYIDLLALYKVNRLHLHLTDDQGWRIEIAKWPKLTTVGGSTEVKGGPGGFYTRTEYADIVAYARDRFMTVVPEIDMPSHCNAALAAYPELNCDGKAPAPYTGIEVGFSNFCFDKPITYRFLDDVLRELAAMTPGPWLHVGGDEVKKMTPGQYAAFMERAQGLVIKHGKIPVGWDEIIHSKLQPSTVVQYLAPGRVHGPAAGDEAHPVARQPHLPRHEVRRGNRAGPRLGRQGGRGRALHVGPGEAPRRGRIPDSRGRGADLVRDAVRHRRPGVPAVPPVAGSGRTGVDAASVARLERLPRAPGRPGAALVGARHQRLLVAEDRLEAVEGQDPSAPAPAPMGEGADDEGRWFYVAAGTRSFVLEAAGTKMPITPFRPRVMTML